MEAGSPKGATKQHQAPIFGDLGGSKWSKNNLIFNDFSVPIKGEACYTYDHNK